MPGALAFGYLGDRFGRKFALVVRCCLSLIVKRERERERENKGFSLK